MIDNSADAVLERIKKRVHEEQERRDIICPYCNHKQDNETRGNYVSYWGEDEEKECDCESCNKKFKVKEEVERQFFCKKMEDIDND